MKKLRFWFILILILTCFFTIYIIWGSINHSSTPQNIAVVSDYANQGMPDIGGTFELIDHTGQKRTDRDFRGKFMMVYFGYRYCPDICPTALSTMTESLEMLGSKAQHIQLLFITVDPERDKIEDLAEYIQNFHPNFIALTGEAAQIERARKAYRVFAVRAEEKVQSTDYLIDHSSIIYVMNRQGKFIAHFNHATPAEQIVKALRKVL